MDMFLDENCQILSKISTHVTQFSVRGKRGILYKWLGRPMSGEES